MVENFRYPVGVWIRLPVPGGTGRDKHFTIPACGRYTMIKISGRRYNDQRMQRISIEEAGRMKNLEVRFSRAMKSEVESDFFIFAFVLNYNSCHQAGFWHLSEDPEVVGVSRSPVSQLLFIIQTIFLRD